MNDLKQNLMIAPLILGGLLGCGSSGLQEDQEVIRDLLNRREFISAVSVCQESLRIHRDDEIASLCVQAHLGAAGFEIVRFVYDVAINDEALTNLPVPDSIACKPSPLRIDGRIPDASELPCTFLRILNYAPDPDHPHMTKARSLLSEYFGDIPMASTQVNTLGMFVEVGSALGRLLKIARAASEGNDNTPTYQRELARFYQQGLLGLLRGIHSHRRISELFVRASQTRTPAREDVIPAFRRLGLLELIPFPIPVHEGSELQTQDSPLTHAHSLHEPYPLPHR